MYWFHAGAYRDWYFTAGFCAWNFALLKALILRTVQAGQIIRRYTNASTNLNRFNHSPPLPVALAPFAGLADAGCSESAAAEGSNAIAPSAAACWSAPENWTQRRMWKKAAEVFDDLGLGMSASTGNLEDYLIESGQRVAADWAALASVLVLSSSQRGDRIYHNSAILSSKKQ